MVTKEQMPNAIKDLTEFSHCSINNHDEHLYFYIDILETN